MRSLLASRASYALAGAPIARTPRVLHGREATAAACTCASVSRFSSTEPREPPDGRPVVLRIIRIRVEGDERERVLDAYEQATETPGAGVLCSGRLSVFIAWDGTAMSTAAQDTRGYEILRGAVPMSAVDRALRHLHLDLVQNGSSAETISRWLWSAHWFPHLKWDTEIVGLLESLPAELREGELCDPQILLHPPDADQEVSLTPHTDEEPEWANGRPYLRIVGIALTPNRRTNGGLVVWPLADGEPEAVDLEPGDAVVMDPRLPHTSGLNREGSIRYAAYFRFLMPG